MLRPLVFDLAGFVAPVAAGAFAFLAGRFARRMSSWLLVLLFATAFVTLIASIVALFADLPIPIEQMVSRIGGATIPLCWVALFLLGVVWSQPNRRLSSGFLTVIAGFAICLLATESSGRLMWRFLGQDAWQRRPDTEGRIAQSSGQTCSPAAAAMLLHFHGVESSEGEMAYLSGTTLLGTDAYSIARALDAKLESRGLHASVERLDFESLRRRLPAIVHVTQPSGHALLVRSVSDAMVNVHDPLSGSNRSIAKSEFEQMWDGTTISIAPR